MEKIYTLQLTKSQLINLKEFLEFNFIQCIREDDTVDNIDYLVDMCVAYKQMADMLSVKGGGE